MADNLPAPDPLHGRVLLVTGAAGVIGRAYWGAYGADAKAYPGEDSKTHPLPEEIAASFLYLLGPDSRGLSGRAFRARRGNRTPLESVKPVSL